ncbi:MAG TPA: hypothetical protein VFJ16_23770 [Longimicrobium sp.]|nr:hypothetical protein [Longimicrobium sp.]
MERRAIPRFTNREVLKAFAEVMPASETEGAREVLQPPDELCRAFVTDGLYLLMAALSPEYAERIVDARPELAAEVAAVRSDPDGYLARHTLNRDGDADP